MISNGYRLFLFSITLVWHPSLWGVIDCLCLPVSQSRKPRWCARLKLTFIEWTCSKMNGADFRGISVHNFSEKILEQVVHFHVMKLDGGFFLWVGSAPVLSNLAVSLNSKYVSTEPRFVLLTFNFKLKPER